MVESARRNPPSWQALEDEESEAGGIKYFLGLCIGAPRRHRMLAVGILLGTLAVGVLAVAYWPRSYDCEARMMIQREAVLPSLTNPTRAPEDDGDLTRNARDTILQRNNILAMIEQLDLLDRWVAARQPAARLMDRIASVFSARSSDDRLRDLIAFLDERLAVACDASSIVIAVEWPDREQAFEIVAFLQRNFLEARYDSKVQVISEAIRVLEAKAKPEADEVETKRIEVTTLQASRALDLHNATTAAQGSPKARIWRAFPALGSAPPAKTSGAAQELEDTRRRIQLLKEDHDRQLLQAQNEISDARAILGPLHPTIVGLQEKLGRLAANPPELQMRQARERELLGESVAAPAKTRWLWSPAPAAPAAPAASRVDVHDAPDVVLAQSELQAVWGRHSELLARIDAANIELAAAQAAFKFQYHVVRPAQIPRQPSKPNAPRMVLAFILAAALLSVLVPGGLDLLRGRFVEEWQLERVLGVPMLGRLGTREG
jgi:uncharacterized protein involved in exopolysaccharide biosynthesis